MKPTPSPSISAAAARVYEAIFPPVPPKEWGRHVRAVLGLAGAVEAARDHVGDYLAWAVPLIKNPDRGTPALAIQHAWIFNDDEALAAAAGSGVPHLALLARCRAVALARAGKPVPPALRPFLGNPPKRGRRRPPGFTLKGAAVASAVNIALGYGLPLTQDSDGATAFAVVSGALKAHGVDMTPDAVRAAWRRQKGPGTTYSTGPLRFRRVR